MFTRRVESISGAASTKEKLDWRKIAIAGAKVTAVGFVMGLVAERGVNQVGVINQTSVVESFVAQDGFIDAEADTSNPKAATMGMVAELGSCPLRATIYLDRNSANEVTDVNLYQFNVLSNTETYPNGVGSLNDEQRTIYVTNYDGLLAEFQGQDPCQFVHSA